MKDMKIRALFEQEVYINPAEAFRALEARLGFAPRSMDTSHWCLRIMAKIPGFRGR